MRRRPDALGRFFIHTIYVEEYQGQDADGVDLYAPPSPVVCFVEESTRLARTADGTEGMSTVQAYARAATVVALDSRVTLPSGRVTQLMSLERHDGGRLGLPDHVTLNLE